MLLIHGLGGTPLELKGVATGLNRAGFSVSVCQLAGHCGSEADLAATRWPHWYTSVESGLERLREHCTHVFAGGLSMGAILALRLAAQKPEALQGLLLFAPTLFYDGWAVRNQRWMMQWLRPLIDTPFGRRYRFVEREPFGIKDPRMRAIVQAALASGDSAQAGVEGTPALSLREMWRLVEDVQPLLGTIKTRSLIIHPREDDVSSLRNVYELQRNLGGLVDTLILDDSYHLITLDRQRGLVLERSLEFIERLAPRAVIANKPQAPAARATRVG